ncbi:MAG: hypothetical protein K0S21_2963 [Rhizobiaceae bacterium]|nr:hypothetical protein [Rhizobiaceae bacterium]
MPVYGLWIIPERTGEPVMMACWLRCVLAAEASVLVSVVAFLVSSGTADPLEATAIASGIFLALNSCPVVVSFAVSGRGSGSFPAESGKGVLSRSSVRLKDWLAFLIRFIAIQPFEWLWMGDEAVDHDPALRPVLLVHGYLCNRGFWWWMRRRLRAAGFPVATVNLEPPLGGIDGFGEQLHTRIESLLLQTGGDRVDLVCHSMGGLAALAYLRRHGPGRVGKLVTLACPFHGSWLARLGPGGSAREMEHRNAWLNGLPDADSLGVTVLSVWSPADNIVVPPDSSRLAGARERLVPSLGHLAFAFSPVIPQILLGELAA